MAEYKILLGTQLDTSDIVSQINKAESQIDPIKIKVDAETKELTKSIQDALKTLSGGTKNALTLDTSKFEGSIADIKSAVVDLKKVLGTLDDSANMKSLLASVNQIANAIGKVTDESETLAKSLSILSKKDFGFNFNLKTGNVNPIKAATDYGQAARRNAIPAMEEQIAYLKNILGGTVKADKALSNYLFKAKQGFSGVTEKDRLVQEMSGVDAKGNSISDIKRMSAHEKMIDYLKKTVIESGKSLDGFNAKFSKSAESIVDDTVKIQTGVKQTEEAVESAANEMKQIFSMGVGAEQLSAQLEPIVGDLKQIREAVQSLSSGVSLEGLTSSFNRLSESIENLLANAEKVKGVLNSGFDGGNAGNASTSTPSSAVKSAQQTGHQIGETVKQSVKQSLTLDDVIDEQVQNLMSQYGIKGKKAFEEIRQAVVEYRKELQLANNIDFTPNIDDPFGFYDDDIGNSADIRKVIDAVTRNVGRVPNSKKEELEEKYGRIWDEMRGTQKSGKITIPVEYKYEFPDDFRGMVRHLPTRFSTKPGGMGFDSWFSGLSDDLKETIIHYKDNVSENICDHFKNASDIWNLRGSEPAFLYDDDILKHDDYSTIPKEIDSVIDVINQRELELAQTSTQTANTIVQNENKKRQEYEQTKQEIANLEQAIEESYKRIANPDLLDPNEPLDEQIRMYQSSIDYMEQRKAELSSKLGTLGEDLQVDKLDAFKNSLQSVGMDTDAIDNVVNRIQNLGIQIDTLNQKRTTSGKKDILSVDISGVDEFGNAIRLTEEYNAATGDLVKTIDRVSTVQQKAGASTDSFAKQQKTAVSNLTNQINQMNRAANDPNASRPIKDSSHLDSLKAKYNEIISAIERMENASSDTFVDEQNNVRKLISEYKSLVSEYKNAENVSTKMKGTDFGSGLDIARNDLEKFKAEAKDFPQITDTVKELDKAIEGVGDAASLNKFNDQLRVGRSELAKIKAETAAANRNTKVGIDVSGITSQIENIQRISPEIDKFETEIDGAKVSVKSLLDDLSRVNTASDFSVVRARFKSFKEAAEAAGIAVTETAQKVKSINDIKIKISDTGFNGFEQEVLRARNAAEELEGVYPDLEDALKRLDTAIEDVYSADQAGDVKRLVAANEEYEASLKQVYSQLKLYQQEEQKAYKTEMLNQKKSALSSEMETWLKENTRAARDFGEEIRRLQASLNGLDDKGVKLVGQQFKAITKQAQTMGKTGLTVFDRLKLKIKEYSSYLSAAELFMHAEQAMRSMFEQVKLIDSAMTELKKVTDETDASYNQFLSNAASRSKELGTTIDGLVSSTADFARLGYGFEDAQGLAEVANIYAVVGDEIEGVEGATESLISTMAAFKDSATGMSNSDFAMSIIDKFNEIGNNFAISSGGIGEALERSASSLMAANATLDESVALITASNQVVQDPVAVGTAWKTISMRMKSPLSSINLVNL